MAGSGSIDGHIDYYSDVYDAASISAFIESYLAVLSAAVADWELPIGVRAAAPGG